MRLIRKRNSDQIPLLFRQWLEENAETIRNWEVDSSKSGDSLWQQLGKTFGLERETNIDPTAVKHVLETSLFWEQNGLCCYCGNLLEFAPSANGPWLDISYRAIEHFEPKKKHKNKTFEYANLILCCKESQKLDRYEIGKERRGNMINSIDDIVRLSQLPRETIVNYPPNSNLNFSQLSPGNIIHVPNPPHCDDEKSKFDAQQHSITIINPTTDAHLIELLIFSNDGSVNFLPSETSQNEIISNTLRVLALNCQTLVARRREKWLNAYINYFDDSKGIFSLLNETAQHDPDDAQLRTQINSLLEVLIIEKAQPDDDNLLEAFYFVEIAFLKSLFNAQV